MTRNQLEHVIRAAGAIVDQDDLVIVGSQSLLGIFPNAPREFLKSMEADLYPRYRPELSIQIDGAIGEMSPFHQTFGYYAHGVDPSTATLPQGWESRLVGLRNQNTRGVTGWCLEVHDLAFSKLVAGREKDLEFVNGLIRRGMVTVSLLLSRLEVETLDPRRKEMMYGYLKRWAG